MKIQIENMENALVLWQGKQVLVEIVETDTHLQVCVNGNIVKEVKKIK